MSSIKSLNNNTTNLLDGIDDEILFGSNIESYL